MSREFRLSEHQVHSEVWMAVREHLVERLAGLRIQNDRPLTTEDTARLRGRIEEVKALLDLEKPLPKAPAE